LGGELGSQGTVSVSSKGLTKAFRQLLAGEKATFFVLRRTRPLGFLGTSEDIQKGGGGPTECVVEDEISEEAEIFC